jgi:hypothetical protein
MPYFHCFLSELVREKINMLSYIELKLLPDKASVNIFYFLLFIDKTSIKELLKEKYNEII